MNPQPTLFTLILALATASAAPAADAKPNILLIFTDDQGYTDLGIHDIDPDVRTPNLDQLARDGALFLRGYTTAPQCVPSRAGLITGRHQNAFGVDDNNSGPLPHGESTIAERLAKVGYTTGMVGKWHLDIGPGADKGSLEFLPHRHGFQEYFCGSLQNYHASHDLTGNALENPPQRVRDTRYRIDVQTEAALSFLDRRRADEKPFFLYLAYFAPHAPVEAPPSYLERMAHVRDPQRRKGLASILAIDDGIGKIRAKLASIGAADNTLIFYISDNGAPLRQAAYIGSHNHPMTGEKGMLTDGGQRVPFIAAWPGRIPPGTTFDHPVWTLDATATALAAAGAPTNDKIEGANLLPWLNGAKQGPVHDLLCWRWRSQAAILSGNWKLVLLGDRQRYLFDLTKPGRETAAHNRLAQHPEIAADLEKKLIATADTWRTKGLPQEVVRPDQLFFDTHIDGKPLSTHADLADSFVHDRWFAGRFPTPFRVDRYGDHTAYSANLGVHASAFLSPPMKGIKGSVNQNNIASELSCTIYASHLLDLAAWKREVPPSAGMSPFRGTPPLPSRCRITSPAGSASTMPMCNPTPTNCPPDHGT